MLLLASTDTLEVVLAGAITTNHLHVFASYVDLGAVGDTFEPGNNGGVLTNNTTAVNVLPATLASGKIRQLKQCSIFNRDTATATVTLQIHISTNTWIYQKFILLTGERAVYNEGGWSVFAADGTPKGSSVSSVNGFTGAVLVPTPFGVACSDLVTNLATGTNKGYFRAPYAMANLTYRASLLTVSSSGDVGIDINKNGSTILTTKLTIDANEKTSVTTATPYVATSTSCADDDEFTFDIDAAGTGARGLVVWIIGNRQ